MAVAEVIVVTMMEVTVVTMKAGGMLLVTMKAEDRIKHIKMETQPVSGMDINGSVTNPRSYRDETQRPVDD